MTGNELITNNSVRQRIYDTLKVIYSDDELLSYLNEAIVLVWKHLSNNQYYEVIGDHTFTLEEETLPANFLKFTAMHPIMIKYDGENNVYKAHTYASLPQVTRYVKKVHVMEGLDDELPFINDALNNILAQVVIMLALNRNEYAVEFEKGIIADLMQATG